MTLSLKDVNELNKERLTIAQVLLLYEKHGYAAQIFSGKIKEFALDSYVSEDDKRRGGTYGSNRRL